MVICCLSGLGDTAWSAGFSSTSSPGLLTPGRTVPGMFQAAQHQSTSAQACRAAIPPSSASTGIVQSRIVTLALRRVSSRPCSLLVTRFTGSPWPWRSTNRRSSRAPQSTVVAGAACNVIVPLAGKSGRHSDRGARCGVVAVSFCTVKSGADLKGSRALSHFSGWKRAGYAALAASMRARVHRSSHTQTGRCARSTDAAVRQSCCCLRAKRAPHEKR